MELECEWYCTVIITLVCKERSSPHLGTTLLEITPAVFFIMIQSFWKVGNTPCQEWLAHVDGEFINSPSAQVNCTVWEKSCLLSKYAVIRESYIPSNPTFTPSPPRWKSWSCSSLEIEVRVREVTYVQKSGRPRTQVI